MEFGRLYVFIGRRHGAMSSSPASVALSPVALREHSLSIRCIGVGKLLLIVKPRALLHSSRICNAHERSIKTHFFLTGFGQQHTSRGSWAYVLPKLD